MDWASSICTIVVAIASPLATVAVQLLNNKHNAKMQKVEFFEETKLKHIEQYVQSVNNCILQETATPEFEKLSFSIELYVPPNCAEIAEQIRFNIETKNFYFVRQNLTDFCKLLRKKYN